ncbi:Ig-like domain-containing protein [Spirosoma endbachense]|uniref:T9SS type A sorting domain-containing protein n=1 Tax=Spirosoma endbachense TaxID=2666025 RepID=A0A6P1VS17_9BACT|nr:T9SS type A sorting domain-containing protein [Spirosoma endbachense]QHV95485.1 T9SS type A sorting domain-containing protein [Spirosoma endbachense]
MKGRLIYPYLFICLCLTGPTIRSVAQTITTNALSVSALCGSSGGTLSVPFSTTGIFLIGNVFTAQISDPNGVFSGTTTPIGTLALVPIIPTTATITATIPKTLTASANYRIRVIASTPARTSTNAQPLSIQAIPNAPGVSDKSYCVGEVAGPLSATTVSGATLNWYAGPVGGNASSLAPTPITTAAGSTTYHVSQTLNGCESSRTSFVVTVSGSLAAPKTAAPAAICQGVISAALTATASAGATLRWWGTNASGGSFSTTPTVPSSQATATYYVSQIINSCESPRASIVVTVKPAPTTPSAPLAMTYCQSGTATPLSATASADGTLNWYGTSAAGGVASSTPTTPNIGTTGTTFYYVSQTIGGCESPRAIISVQVKPKPAAPITTSPIIFCQNRVANPLTAISTPGGTLNWYGTNATGGTASATAPTPSTSVTGSTVYYVSQSINGCEGPRASLTATVNPVPGKPIVAAAGPYCEGSKPNSLTATGQSLSWYGTNPEGGTPSSVATVPNTTVIGTANYYVTQTVNGCESDRAVIPVIVKDAPNAPGTAPLEFCQNSAVPALTATFVANATASWYTDAASNTGSQTPPLLQNSTPGQTTYYVSQSLDGCPSPKASLVVTVKATPSVPGVSSVSYCNNVPSQQLTATGTNIKWYDASDKLINGVPTPATNNVGDQTFKATQTVNGCESAKAVLTVSVKPLPALPGVTNLTYCQAQKDQPVQAIPPLTANGQNLRWYNADGNVYQGAPTPPVTQSGTFSFLVTQTVDNCESSKATIQVSVRTTPAPTVPKPVVSYCLDEKAAPLEAVGEPGSTLRWVDPYGRETTSNPVPPTLNVNVEPGGDIYYVYQINNGCYSGRSIVKVIVNTIPTLSLTGSASINLGQKTPLRLKFTGNPPFSYTLTGGNSGISNSTDTTISVLPRGNTTYQVNAVTNSCGIGLPGNPATAIVLVQAPTITTSAVNNNTLCAGSALIVPFTTIGSFTSGNLFRAELISVADTSKKFELPTSSASSPVTAALSATLAGGQYYVRVKGSNPDIGILGTNSPTTITVRSKPAATLTGNQTINVGTPANLTISFGGDGPWTVTYADSVRSFSATTTTNPYIAEVRPARTTTYKLNNVSNTCGSGTISGTATILVQTVLGVEDTSLDPLVRVYPVPTATTLTIDIDVSLTRDPAELSLTDLRGRPIHQLTTRSRQTELDLSSQPAGVYLLRIQIGDRQSVRKVLKQ